MRKIAMLAVGLTAFLGGAGVSNAAAPATSSTFTGTISPQRAGTLLFPRAVTFRASATVRNPDGSQPPQVSVIQLGLDRNLRQNGLVFPKCTSARAQAAGTLEVPSCRTARIGSSDATAQVGTSVLRFKTVLYNGGAGKLVVTVDQQDGDIFRAFDAPITRGRFPYGPTYNFSLPADLRNPAPGLYPSLTGLQNVKIGGVFAFVRRRVRIGSTFVFRVVRVPYLESIGCRTPSSRTRVGSYSITNTFKFSPTPPQPVVGPNLTKNVRSLCLR